MRLFKCAIHWKDFHVYFQCACCYIILFKQEPVVWEPCFLVLVFIRPRLWVHDCFEGLATLFFARFTSLTLTSKGFNDCTVSMYWESCVSQFLVSFTWGSLKWPWLRRIWWLTAQFPFTTEHLVCHYPLSSPLEQAPFVFLWAPGFRVKWFVCSKFPFSSLQQENMFSSIGYVSNEGDLSRWNSGHTPTEEKWQFSWGDNRFL